MCIQLGQNHIEGRCLMIILEDLANHPQLTIEELDLTVIFIDSLCFHIDVN